MAAQPMFRHRSTAAPGLGLGQAHAPWQALAHAPDGVSAQRAWVSANLADSAATIRPPASASEVAETLMRALYQASRRLLATDRAGRWQCFRVQTARLNSLLSSEAAWHALVAWF